MMNCTFHLSNLYSVDGIYSGDGDMFRLGEDSVIKGPNNCSA